MKIQVLTFPNIELFLFKNELICIHADKQYIIDKNLFKSNGSRGLKKPFSIYFNARYDCIYNNHKIVSCYNLNNLKHNIKFSK